MTKEELTKKLEELNKQKEQLIAQVNFISGAIHMINDLIIEFDKEKSEKKED